MTEARIQALVEGTAVGTYTVFDCRSLRIGTLRAVPRDRVIVSTVGLRLKIPRIDNGTLTPFTISSYQCPPNLTWFSYAFA